MPKPSQPEVAPIAIRVWRELGQQIAAETDPYLSIDKFVLQKDAYMRLADDEVEGDVPFLSYDHSEITSDESLDFSMYLFAGFVTIHIGPTVYQMSYYALGFGPNDIIKADEAAMLKADPAVIARNLLLAVKLMLNGQIAGGCTWRNGELLAFETFLLGFETRPLAIAIFGKFGWFNRAGADYGVKQNRLLPGHFKIPADFPFLPPVVNGRRVQRGRSVDSLHNLEPLSLSQYRQLVTASSRHEFMDGHAKPSALGSFYQKLTYLFKR